MNRRDFVAADLRKIVAKTRYDGPRGGRVMYKLLFAGLVIVTLQGCASEPERPVSRSTTNTYCMGVARQRANDAADNSVEPPLQKRIYNDVYSTCLQNRARQTGSP